MEKIVEFSKDDTIFNEGERSNCAYYIKKGTIELFKDSPNGIVYIGSCNEGEYLGEMGVVDGENRSCSAVAKDDVVLEKISKPNFIEQLKKDGNLSVKVIENLVERLRKTDDMVVEGKAKQEVKELIEEEKTTKRRKTRTKEERRSKRRKEKNSQEENEGENQKKPQKNEVALVNQKQKKPKRQSFLSWMLEPLKGQSKKKTNSSKVDFAIFENDREDSFRERLFSWFNDISEIEKERLSICYDASYDDRQSFTQTKEAILKKQEQEGADLTVWGRVHRKYIEIHFTKKQTDIIKMPPLIDDFLVLYISKEPSDGEIALIRAMIVCLLGLEKPTKTKLFNDFVVEDISNMGNFSVILGQRELLSKINYNHISIGWLLLEMGVFDKERSWISMGAKILSNAKKQAKETDGIKFYAICWLLARMYQILGKRASSNDMLEIAIANFDDCINNLDKGKHKLDIAVTKIKNGQALYETAIITGLESAIIGAIECFHEALGVINLKNYPEQWSEYICKMANMLVYQATQYDEIEAANQAVSCSAAALKLKDVKKTPIIWAKTANTLASSLFTKGKMSSDVEMIKKSMQFFTQAIEVYKRSGAFNMARIIEKNYQAALKEYKRYSKIMDKKKSEEEYRRRWRLAIEKPAEVKVEWLDALSEDEKQEKQEQEEVDDSDKDKPVEIY